jgi:hypothetical protein
MRAFVLLVLCARLMAYASRIGEMPTYSTVYNTLKCLATHEDYPCLQPK